MQIAASLWIWALVGYGLGLMTGWLIWRAAKRNGALHEESEAREARFTERVEKAHAQPAQLDAVLAATAPPKSPPPLIEEAKAAPSDDDALIDDDGPARLAALEAALAEARAELAQAASDEASLETLIEELSDALKRANGRLKLLARSLDEPL